MLEERIVGKEDTATKIDKQKKIKKKKIILIILGTLILFRIFLPFIVLKYVNNKLAKLNEYYGHVEDIDIALLRGAYVIKELNFFKINDQRIKKDTIPFFVSPLIDLSVEWRAIFKGAFVGEIYVEDPKLNFVKGTHKNENIKADTSDWHQVMKMMPLTINHFEITNGQIHFIDNTISPAIDVAMTDINAKAINLSNVNDSAKLLPAHMDASGKAYDGVFKMTLDFNALNRIPTFDLNAELMHMNLTKLNPFLKAYGNFEVEKGDFGLYTEFAAKNNEYGGYVKPLIKDMKVALWKKEEGITDKLWELIVSGVSKLLRNGNTRELGTKIPIKEVLRKLI